MPDAPPERLFPERRPIAEVLRAHVENAAHFWVLLTRAAEALPEGDPEVQKWLRRLTGQLEGARLGGGAALALAGELAADTGEAPEVFVLSALALSAGRSEELAQSVALAEASPAAVQGVMGAVWLAPRAVLAPYVAGWLNSRAWPERMAGIAACLRWGQSPGRHLEALVADGVAEVRAQALRLPGAEVFARARLADPDPAVRLEAGVALMRAGGPVEDREAGAAALRALAADDVVARERPEVSAEALDRAVTGSEARALAGWIKGLWEAPKTAALALRAVGINGDPKSWPLLVAQMGEAGLAHAAGLAAADMLGREPAEGELYTSDTARLPDGVAAAHDLDFTVLPDATAFAAALKAGRLAPASGAEMSLRARRLDRLRREAAAPRAKAG